MMVLRHASVHVPCLYRQWYLSVVFVSAETPKTTLHCTYRTVHFLVLILLFSHEFESDEQFFWFFVMAN